MMNTDDYIVVMSTTSSNVEAGLIGKELVNRKLAACVNVIPGTASYYNWDGETKVARELVVLVKTRKENYNKVKEIIKEHHSYEIPEIIALPILMGDDDYLKWIDESSCGEE